MADELNIDDGAQDTSIMADLAAAMDEIEGAQPEDPPYTEPEQAAIEAEPDEKPEPEASAEEAAPEPEATKDSKEAGDDFTEPEEKPEAEAKPEAQPEETPLEPPARFREVHKDMFKTLPREAQQFLLDRHQEMDKDYQQKSKENAEAIKAAETYTQLVGPFQQFHAAMGVDSQTAIKALLGMDHALRTGTPEVKQRVLAQIMHVARIDPRTLEFTEDIPERDHEPMPPWAQQLSHQVDTIGSELTQERQRGELQTQEEVDAAVNAFRDATDATGNLTHPYYEDVRSEMSRHMQQVDQAGGAPDLKDAYERACWADPDIRQRLQADLTAKAQADATTARQADEAKAANERAEKVKAARKASPTIGEGGTKTTPAVPERPDDVRSEIDQVMTELSSP